MPDNPRLTRERPAPQIGMDETDMTIDVRDPVAQDLKAALETAEDTVAALLGFENVFGAVFPRKDTFTAAFRAAFDTLTSSGARAAIKSYVTS